MTEPANGSKVPRRAVGEAAAPQGDGRDAVVVGASAGGVEGLKQLVSRLPPKFPAATIIVLHVSPRSTSVLPAILARAGALPAAHVVDGERLDPGRLYVAPPDQRRGRQIACRATITPLRGPRGDSRGATVLTEEVDGSKDRDAS